MHAPDPQPSTCPPAPGRRALALGVHIFTATGVIWGFLALLAIARGDVKAMFLWLAVALFVDGIDGTIARRIDIVTAAPRWSGAALDLVVDFITYVLVPAYAVIEWGRLAPGWDIAAAALILLTSAMYFADNEMKTEDAWFKGFPAVWNLVVFYFFLLEPGAVTTFVVVAVLSALTFAPIVFVHPFRVAKLRAVTLTLLMVWSVLALHAIWRDMRPEAWEVWTLSGIAVYFLVLGYFRTKPGSDAAGSRGGA
ncbi:CDP-alcohol phosphatidyltransferase family protein [Labrys wisconsinensis]|uniref:Phosphatidylcholine synthase n=1 Tax=Labrys wisconsinensis TaxID=425677 RepID=A0ABU0J5B3_9HYPH|nr:CDP-alcohol phosphatidyltransferase family protein [Labrys wisconsinensis]MDQ0469452.1 phosphatidylcholine synthase [Labrys wisconsinensis]